MIIYRQHKFSDIGTIGGLGVGAFTGGFLGNRVHARISQYREERKFDPEKEAEKLDKEASDLERKAKKLEKDKNYVSKVRKAWKNSQKDYETSDETEWDSIDENYNKVASKGNPDTYRWDAENCRDLAKKIRQNPKEAKKQAGRKVYENEKLDLGNTGGKIGAIAGGILGAIGGSKIKLKKK